MLKTTAIILILIILGAGLFLTVSIYRELGNPTERSLHGPGAIRIESGASLRSTCEALADSGWIRHPRAVAWWGMAKGIDRAIQAGRYRLKRGWTPREVIGEIVAGRVETVRVTVPEGWRESQVLKLLADSLEIDHDLLIAASRDTAWMRGVGIPGDRLEGYLFPETYSFPKEYNPRLAIRRMIDESEQRFDEAMQRRAKQLGMTRDQVVIFASIIQAEAARVDEMPRISGVFHNRLKLGWKLEADPTVLYALGRFTGPVLYRDLEVESAYNTYRVTGLPPGAIGNPGSEALMAALWPDSTRGEYYFVASGNGEHLFSRTLAEHNRARRSVRALNRNRR